MKYERGSFIVVPSREKLRGMPVPAQALYMWLCSYANETGECYPSRATLAKDCDCTLPTVDRFTQLLVDRGLLIVEKRFKNNEQITNLYSLLIWEGGGKGDLPPGKNGLPGVVKDVSTELNPIITKPTQVIVNDSERPERISYSEKMGYASNRVKPIRVRGEEIIGHKFPTVLTQEVAISKCLRAGYTEEEIIGCLEALLEDKFWGEKGVDFSIVLSQIGKGKKKSKSNTEINSKYAKYA